MVNFVDDDTTDPSNKVASVHTSSAESKTQDAAVKMDKPLLDARKIIVNKICY